MSNQTIYKYRLKITDEQDIAMPFTAEVLSVAMQRGELCVWALVNPGLMLENRRFHIAGTGHPAPIGRFIGTVQQAGGDLIWHVFDGGAVPSPRNQ